MFDKHILLLVVFYYAKKSDYVNQSYCKCTILSETIDENILVITMGPVVQGLTLYKLLHGSVAVLSVEFHKSQ